METVTVQRRSCSMARVVRTDHERHWLCFSVRWRQADLPQNVGCREGQSRLSMYKDALKTLERKFGQPQAVVTAYLDKLANVPPGKMHNSKSITSYSATLSSLVGVFRSLNYNQDLSSASLVGQAVQKLPPNMKQAWSMHTVKRSLHRPTLQWVVER